MTHALALDGRDIALDLHELLRDIDPARWRDEVEEAVLERFDAVRARIAALDERFEHATDAYADEALASLHDRLVRVSALLDEYLPDDGSAVEGLAVEWAELRGRLQPAYEGLVEGLKLQSIHVPSLRPTNYARNAFHVTSALVSLVLIETVLDAVWMLGIAAAIAAAAWSMEAGKRLSDRVDRATWWVFGKMGHPHERRRVNSATWFSTALLLLALTGSHVVCAVSLAVMGLADPAAGLIGRRFGRVELIHGRTLEGTTAFVVVGGAGALAALLLAHPQLGWPAMVGMAACAVLPAAAAELFAHRVDDNLLVPGGAAAGDGNFGPLVGGPLR